jgi:hypothetical protein
MNEYHAARWGDYMDKEIIKGVKKNVFVLGLVSFFTDISSEMLYP